MASAHDRLKQPGQLKQQRIEGTPHLLKITLVVQF
jgi:hypothetical protein